MVYSRFINLKKEELLYIEKVHKLSLTKTLTEDEMLEIFRQLNDYATRLKNMYKSNHRQDYCSDAIVSKDYLSDVDSEKRENILYLLRIDPDTLKFTKNIFSSKYKAINISYILNGQYFKPIYAECGLYDPYGDGETTKLLYIYALFPIDTIIEIEEKQDFEKDKTIIRNKPYVYGREIPHILREEMLNENNKTMNDCIKATEKRIDELSYANSPEGKKQLLLDKVNNLYKKVKGEFINEEILYNGKFLEIIRETYKLPNEKTVQKEKVVKNNNKNAVVVVAITQDENHTNKYIITVQNRVRDKLIAEFPGGYIEENETPEEAAKRELLEETGYVANTMFTLEESYTSPGIDNSITYIVVASDCCKVADKTTEGTELVEYDLFTKDELDRLIRDNIMCGGISKLAYYSLKDNDNIYMKRKK